MCCLAASGFFSQCPLCWFCCVPHAPTGGTTRESETFLFFFKIWEFWMKYFLVLQVQLRVSCMDESSVLHVTSLRKIFHKEQKVGIRKKPDIHRKNLGVGCMIFGWGCGFASFVFAFLWKPHTFCLLELIRMQIPFLLVMD